MAELKSASPTTASLYGPFVKLCSELDPIHRLNQFRAFQAATVPREIKRVSEICEIVSRWLFLAKMISGVSAYTGMSRSRSATSLAGRPETADTSGMFLCIERVLS